LLPSNELIFSMCVDKSSNNEKMFQKTKHNKEKETK
jgi:hypothetical protein